MTSDDEFDTLLFPDISDSQWDRLESSLVRGSRLPPPPSTPGGSISLGRSTEAVVQDEGDEQLIIGTQSTFSELFESFTESQQAVLDLVLASSQPPAQTPPGSCHFSNSSSDIDIEENINMPHTRKSLMQLFRPAGTLSVTDLVHPIWCQLKTEYDLRGQKHRGETKRKEIFVTAHNKKITINKEVSKKAAELVKKGVVVHKALEKEIRPLEIPIVRKTREDAWGIRIIDMLANLRALQILGKCRELSVFDFIDGVPVHGIIDEVNRVPFPQPRSMLPSSKKRKRGTGSGQRQTAISFSPPLEQHFTDTRSPLGTAGLTSDRLTFGAPQKMRTHGFYLIDTKTRHSGTIPVGADTLPAVIQLSLYKRLFDRLTSTEIDHGLWDKMFRHEGLKTYQPFSEEFVVQCLMVIETNDMGHLPGILEARCLGELVAVWRKTVEDMGIANVGCEDELTIVYRKNETTVKRGAKKKKLSKAKGKGKGKLKPLPVDVDDMEVDQEGASTAAALSPIEHPPSSESESLSDGDSNIIGQKQFKYDERLLDEHLRMALNFWRGTQKAQGVGIENTRRCNWCEYKEDCEWREEKGLEALKKVRKPSSKPVPNP